MEKTAKIAATPVLPPLPSREDSSEQVKVCLEESNTALRESLSKSEKVIDELQQSVEVLTRDVEKARGECGVLRKENEELKGWRSGR